MPNSNNRCLCCKVLRGGGGLVALPLVLVEPHGEAERVYGEGEYNGGTLLRGYCVQGLKKRNECERALKKVVIFVYHSTFRFGILSNFCSSLPNFYVRPIVANPILSSSL